VDRDINARVYAAVQGVIKHMDPRLTQVEATTGQESEARHFAALHTAHPDYDTVIAAVPAWIKTQPAYLQPAMQAAYDQGTTADVTALVADYKKAAGITAVAPAPAPAPAPKPASDAANLAPVTSRRSAAAPTKGTPDPNDFEGAWAELSAASK
jgi:protein-disulfide isomerase-like protein with CxxC motif